MPLPSTERWQMSRSVAPESSLTHLSEEQRNMAQLWHAIHTAYENIDQDIARKIESGNGAEQLHLVEPLTCVIDNLLARNIITEEQHTQFQSQLAQSGGHDNGITLSLLREIVDVLTPPVITESEIETPIE